MLNFFFARNFSKFRHTLLINLRELLNTDKARVKHRWLILFLSFRRVLNVIYSFLGNSPASEF